ncbi:MAG: hypothetical protein JWR40_3113 [Massilia sp.]|jgi:hypothetical protein|nr:hypothetical protein [Massilia sp.]MDB5949977.1 hypothetical protein [Massilia sp.]
MENNDDKQQELLPGVKTRMSEACLSAGGEALLHPWQRLALQISPLIGETGFCALYGRAIRLVVPNFDWLQAAEPGKSAEQSFVALTGIYNTVHVDAATAANTALLTTFTELLAGLIGQALTRRLLDSASKGRQEQQNVQEQEQ